MTATLIKPINDPTPTTEENTVQVISVVEIRKLNYTWTSPSEVSGRKLTSKRTVVKYTFAEV